MRKNCPLITAVTGFTVLVIGIICAWYAFPKLIDNAIIEVRIKFYLIHILQFIFIQCMLK